MNPRPPACDAGALPLSYVPLQPEGEGFEPPVGRQDPQVISNHPPSSTRPPLLKIYNIKAMPKLCIALDTDYDKAVELINALKDKPIVFKVGYKLFISHHRKITDLIKQKGFELFLDLKLHDIPSTIRNAVLSALDLGADYLTVHIVSGKDALREAVNTAKGIKLLGVTLLTSLEEDQLKEWGLCISKEDYILNLSSLALNCGIEGLVCSGKELPLLKSKFNFFAVVPGVRLYGEPQDDQKRVVRIEEAIRNGADMIVVGRSILTAKDPIKKVEEILKLLENPSLGHPPKL